MGSLGGNRRLGKRSRLYEVLLAPLSMRERVAFAVVIVFAIGFFVITGAGASRSLVGSYVYAPFASCKSPAPSSWSFANQATGQPDADLSGQTEYGRTARLGRVASQLVCSKPSLENDIILNPGVRVHLGFAKDTESNGIYTDGGGSIEAVIDSPDDYLQSERLEPIDRFMQLEWSTDSGKTWNWLADVSSDDINGEFIDARLPDALAGNLGETTVRLSPGAINEEGVILAVDSLGITYQVGQPTSVTMSFQSRHGKDGELIIPASQEITADIELDTPLEGLVEGINAALPGVDDNEPATDINAALVSIDGQSHKLELEKAWLGTQLNGDLKWQVSLSPPRNLAPGRYTLETVVSTENSKTVESYQDVLWGVVALNTAKSSYLPDEPIGLMMSLLDERGASVCDAEINLDIQLEGRMVAALSTMDGQISVTDTCELYGSHIAPDYAAEVRLNQPGTYQIELSAQSQDISYSSSDTVTVEDAPQVVIHRQGPTRLFPVNDYDMGISIEFLSDFRGTIKEKVPNSFSLISQPDQRPYQVKNRDGSKSLIWQIDALSGDLIKLGYTFDAPDISPTFYTLGKLQLESDTLNFTEPRHWQLAGDAIGRMMLFFDGASIPSGWTCVSCSSGDPFYQRFPRGNDTYGGSGGGSTHNHTVATSVSTTANAAASQNENGSTLSDNGHSHTGSTTLTPASNLPSYRQIKIIRYDTAGEPATLPAGIIGMFDSTLPGGWSQYSAQNGYYPYGENTAGATGGNNTHQHSISGSIAAATGASHGLRNGSPVASSNSGHTHTFSGSSSNINSEPPHIDVVFAQLGSSAAPPDGLIAMWDDENPSNWTKQSGPAGNFYQRFFKGAASFGSTGGNSNHSHVDTSLSSSTPSGGSNNSKSGSATASASHTHLVTIESYSTEANVPPYRDVVISKRVPQSSLEQSGYRFYQNDDSADVSSPLAGQNTVATSPRQGQPFRLRLLLHVSNADLASGNRVLKLQYAARSGTCDTSFSGESYADVETASGPIRYYDNASPDDGSNLTTNANDPTHSSDNVIAQTYEEANNFTSTVNVDIGEDGLWDLSLVDFSATASSNYCFRVVRSNGDLLNSYSVIPEIITDDGNGHMLLFYDGGSAPSNWTCVSCNPGDNFYQRFFRGSGSYGSIGGTAVHAHTGSASVSASANNTVNSAAGTAVASGGHSHTFMPTFEDSSNLPTYRQLKIIRANSSGVPSTLPAGAIAVFDGSLPGGWTQYSAQDGNYIRGENTIGSTGGSLSHVHTVTGTTSSSSGSSDGSTNGPQVSASSSSHTHDVSDSSSPASNEPPYIEAILGQLSSSASAPQNIITLWDGPPPGSWTDVSSSGQPFYQNFIKPATSYSATGGSATHNHSNSTITSNGPSSTLSRRSGSVNSSGSHTHSIPVSGVSTEDNLPPYIEVIIAKLGVLNTAPSSPISLDQLRTSDSSSISTGGWSNGGQVKFVADVSDPDNPDDLQICVEVEEVGTSFDNIPTSCGVTSSYSGSTITVDVTISGLTSGSDYHWQAQTKDGSGATSAWVSFGGNPESSTDFSVDSTEPSGTVYDGNTISVDIDFNDGSLNALDGNWNITDGESGIDSFEFSIGTSPGTDDVSTWNNVGTSNSYSASSLTLRTSLTYYLNVKARDNAGNDVTISSDGINVAPTLSFSASPGNISFDNLNVSNSYTDTKTSILTTSTNSYNGYQIRAYITGLPTNQSLDSIGLFNGGSYMTPDEWQTGDIGYGYSSNDATISGTNLFNSAPCAGGGDPPCYAPFSLTQPGDIVADHTDPVTGTAVTNENFVVTHRVTAEPAQPPGIYQTEVIYTVIARY